MSAMRVTGAVALAAAVLSVASACTAYGSGNKVVIGMSGRGGNNWHETGSGGLKYKSHDWNGHHVDGYHGAEYNSRIFANFQVPYSSEYVVAAETVAGHQTEYNDVWGRVWEGQNNAKGMWKRCMCNAGHRTGLGAEPFKMYQNTGGYSKAIYTVDHNPHAITGWFEAGRTYTFEVTGRSMQFDLKKIALVACSGNECTPQSGTVRGALGNMGGSNCY